jgi:hypothetical protein
MQDVKMTDLTPDEIARPFSKYFYKPLAQPAAERVAAMDRPIDPSLALPADRRSDLLNPGDLPCEAGWCVMPDGTGFIANRLPMPGVTVEMVDWWFAWHALEPLRYKIWNPPYHFDISLSERDRAKALDPKRSLREKFQGLTHYVIENCGGPCAEKIAIEFMTPEEFGFDMERFKAPNVGTFAGGKGAAVMLAPPPGVPSFKAPAIMCHLVREIPGGIEFRTRFWMGMRIIDRKAVRCIPDTVRIPDFVVKGLAVHNVHEYANLASFLPQIYAEQNGLVAA